MKRRERGKYQLKTLCVEIQITSYQRLVELSAGQSMGITLDELLNAITKPQHIDISRNNHHN